MRCAQHGMIVTAMTVSTSFSYTPATMLKKEQSQTGGECFRLVSDQGPFACEANVITTTPRKLRTATFHLSMRSQNKESGGKENSRKEKKCTHFQRSSAKTAFKRKHHLSEMGLNQTMAGQAESERHCLDLQ